MNSINDRIELALSRHFEVSIRYYLNSNFGTRQPEVACIYTLGPGYQNPEYAILITETVSDSDSVWTTKTSTIVGSSVLLTVYSLCGWNMEI